MFLLLCFNLLFRLNYCVTIFIFGPMLPTIHHVGQLIRFIFVFQFVHFHWVKVEHIDELGQFLDLNHFICFGRSWVFIIENGVAFFIVMFSHYWHQHFEYLVSGAFPLEISKEHPFENLGGDETFFVFNQLVQLLS
jgi:hypothetical protein